MPSVSLISLGCAKNLVDSEIMAGHLAAAGMTLLPPKDAPRADVVILNTCSFIDAAKQESINLILETGRDRASRKRNPAQKIIVAGCLVQRFQKQLADAIPEMDACVGLDRIRDIVPIVRSLLAEPDAGGPPRLHATARSAYIPDHATPRYQLTPPHFAYLKISEGCNHPCSFCIIPRIRGRHRSRPVPDLLAQARQLVANGVREINLIAQDTTYYGMDTWETRPSPRSPAVSARGDSLPGLLRALDALEGDFWIRLLYTHPAHWSDELAETIAASRKIARYVDIPLQHISDRMLKAMRRETDGAHIRGLLARLRAGIPGLTLRTTFIVGFPGETERDFGELLDFIRETRFERLGVFQYSREEGTRAASLPRQIPAATKERRWHEAMRLQRQIASGIAKDRVGQTLRVLVDAPGVARAQADAPDIDTRVRVSRDLPVGRFADVTIAAARGYDLVAAP
ncbi:MAG: 30S ribosomal protein S12 methylthiotransferase RimO [Opitutaceae bacterium]|nr:30S ribosomal protein S12 methylthiotransferase RimO [Opitutaceae bacterium]